MKRISIVTGASSGMGVCFAQELCKENQLFSNQNRFHCDELWIVARRKSHLIDLKTQLEAAFPNCPNVRVIALDISGSSGANALGDLLRLEYDKNPFVIDCLVNNAGFGTYGEFAQTDIQRQMEMVDLDCTSLTGITGHALPYMEKGCRIIMTASLASFLPLGNFAVYGACKAYVLSFSVALRQELKHRGISVTALCPGPVSTEFANVASKGARVNVLHGKSPEKTVRHAVKSSRKGKFYSMFALKWKFKKFMSHFVSRRLCAWFTYHFCKRPSN